MEDKNYKCDQCGACCQGHVSVEVYDIDILREPHLAAAAIGRPAGQTYRDLMTDLEQDGNCIVIAGSKPSKFLTENFKCAVYATRPNTCVAFAAGSEQCQQARAQAGLEELSPMWGG